MVPGREVNGYLTFTLTQQPWDPRGSTLPLKGQVSGPHPPTHLWVRFAIRISMAIGGAAA